MPAALLDVSKVTKRFGGLVALDSVSLSIDSGKIYGIIGPNGSGKSTLFNVITRILRQEEGSISYKGKNLNRLNSSQVAKLGISRTFQFTRVFKKLTVAENLMAVTYLRDRRATEKVDDVLHIMGFDSIRDRAAGLLPLGQRKLLELARALVTEPELILLDEPMGGLGSESIQRTCDHIMKLRELGKTVVVIEHNMSVAMTLCEHLFVLDHGEMIAEGSPKKISEDERVIKAYLGE